ncbi:ribosomal L1 domain-containing protein 1-like [Atheta coriaria]|uniref:ribosomal L1 domain-containing protein 1-like n=1 Tax=Dalotia coriaria TaxID=877792 RepID=UPI0031F399A0
MAKDKKTKLGLVVARKSMSLVKKPKKSKGANSNLQSPNVSQDMIPQTVEDNGENAELQRNFVEKAVARCLTESETQTDSKELFDDDKVIFLQIQAGKIPKCPTKTLNIKLQHSILPKQHDILLISPDLDPKTDHEKTIEHYREILDKHDITDVKDIIPLHQLRQEYTEYEMQNRLMGLYDLIIADGSVDGYVRKLLGSTMGKKNKPYSTIKLNASNLPKLFDEVLTQSFLKIQSAGDNFSMKIGHTGMEEEQLVDNIMAVAEGLKQKFPGGFAYIKGLFLKTAKGKSVQFYLSSANISSMKTPVVKTETPKVSVKDELSTEMDAKVTVKASGEVVVHKRENVDEELAAAAWDNKPTRARKEPERLQFDRTPKRKYLKKSTDKENIGDDDKKKNGASKKKKAEAPLKEALENKKGKKKAVKAEPQEDVTKAGKPKQGKKPNNAVTVKKNQIQNPLRKNIKKSIHKRQVPLRKNLRLSRKISRKYRRSVKITQVKPVMQCHRKRLRQRKK